MQLDPASAAASQANREEVDSRSVFVGNVSTLFIICVVWLCRIEFLPSSIKMES